MFLTRWACQYHFVIDRIIDAKIGDSNHDNSDEREMSQSAYTIVIGERLLHVNISASIIRLMQKMLFRLFN